MAYDVPPQDASPENLLKICRGLTDGTLTLQEMDESSDIELSDTVISDTVRYGEKLGFLETGDDEKVSLTDRGWEVAFEDEVTDEMSGTFRVGIQDYPLYSDLLEKIETKELVSKGEPESVTQKQILPLLNSDFGFSDLSSSSTLKPATNTFLATLDAAGYGDYVIGRGGKPTRIELEKELDTEKTAISKSEENDEQQSLSEVGEGQEEDEIEEADSPENKDQRQEQNPKGEHTSKSQSTDQDPTASISEEVVDGIAEVTINIEISSEDWESSDVVELITALKDEESN